MSATLVILYMLYDLTIFLYYIDYRHLDMKQKSTAINGLHVDEIFTTIVGLPFIKIKRKFDFNKF